MTQKQKPVVLCILDGWGHREETDNNAVALANTPNYDALLKQYPNAFLLTSGEDVGLPDGQMGNSEVGHTNIGAGRVVFQDLPRISRAIKDGSLKSNADLQALIAQLKQSGKTAHVMGLVSDGGVHSHQQHAEYLIQVLSEAGVKVAVHAWMDGRDTAPQSGQAYLKQLQACVNKYPTAHIATISGRYFSMDRDKRWERVQKAYDAIVSANAQKFASADAAIAQSYANNITDEFVEPAVIGDYAGAVDGDAIVSFNFRSDRIREILEAALLPNFSGFTRAKKVDWSRTITMTDYSDVLRPFVKILFAQQSITRGLGETVSASGLKQLRIAETEKYPHVTFFMNGGREEPWPNEARTLIPSPKVATYDLQPEMSAAGVGTALIEAIESEQYGLIIINFANPDMVGHTGSLPAAIKAVETVDHWLGLAAKAADKHNTCMVIIADHGNAEMMVDPATGGPHTAHTTNPVRIIVTSKGASLTSGRLADVAPTTLHLMGLSQPTEMTGQNLVSNSADRHARSA